MRISRLAALVVSVVTIAGCGWSQQGYDAGSSGYNPAETVIGPNNVGSLAARWTRPRDGRNDFGQLLVRGQRLFSTYNNGMAAFDIKNGRIAWKLVVPRPDATGYRALKPIALVTDPVRGIDLLVASQIDYHTSQSPTPGISGRLFAVDAATGAPVWSVPSGAVVSGVVDAGRLYAVSYEVVGQSIVYDGTLALDVFSGALAFRIPEFRDSVVAGDGRVFGTTTISSLGVPNKVVGSVSSAGCGALDCPVEWTASVGPSNASGDIAISGDRLYVAGAPGIGSFPIAGCGASDCRPDWVAPGRYWHISVGDGRIYATGTLPGGHPNRGLVAFDASGCGAAQCGPVWSSAENVELKKPVIANGVVYAATVSPVSSTDLTAVFAWPTAGCGAATCATAWSTAVLNPDWTSVIVADGNLYVGSLLVLARYSPVTA